MSDTPIFDDLLAETQFLAQGGVIYGEGATPPSRRMELENYLGQRLTWNGKRWYNPETCDGSLQTQDYWPPYDFGADGWREVE